MAGAPRPAGPGRTPSLATLRARYLEAGERPPRAVLAQLRQDPRAGARALLDCLRRRERAARAEKRRLGRLLEVERELWRSGERLVAGVDEVGMGPLAGPVVAAAVILPEDVDIEGVDDSKKLSPGLRARLDRLIRERAVAVGIGQVEVVEIDRLNIYQAGLLAMRRAVLALAVRPDQVLSDARHIPGLPGIAQRAYVHGDGLSYSIACASIVAKVARDAILDRLGLAHPGYGFETHKGYGTPEHLEALRRLGASPAHRLSFPVVRDLAGLASGCYRALHAAIEAASTPEAVAEARLALTLARPELDAAEGRKLGALLARQARRARD